MTGREMDFRMSRPGLLKEGDRVELYESFLNTLEGTMYYYTIEPALAMSNNTLKKLEKLTGITEDMYVDFLAERQILDAHIDTLIIIHAKDDYVGTIEQAIETYRSGLIEQNKNYPQNLSKARASRIETINDYICFVQLGADTTALADRGNEAVMAHCLEENEKALYVLEQAILQ